MTSAARDAREREASVAVKHKVKVLLIDNNEESLDAHTQALDDLGEELVCARTGREGLAQGRVDRQQVIYLHQPQRVQRDRGVHHQPQLGSVGGSLFVSAHQHADARLLERRLCRGGGQPRHVQRSASA